MSSAYILATSYRSSVIGHRSSVIGHRSSVIGHQSSVISHQSSVISHQLSVISYQSSVISHQSSVISHQSSVISHQLSVISYQLSTVHCSLFAQNPQPSAARHSNVRMFVCSIVRLFDYSNAVPCVAMKGEAWLPIPYSLFTVPNSTPYTRAISPSPFIRSTTSRTFCATIGVTSSCRRQRR